MDRRHFLKAGLGAALVAGPLARAGAQDRSGATVKTAAPAIQLWYDRPATQWLEAQPIGNGRLGAMVYGGTDTETLQLNEETILAGGQASYQTAGSLTLDLGHGPSVTDYRRQLDLDTAIVTISYTAGGVRYSREAFVSVPDQVIVVRLTADGPGKVSFVAALTSPQQATVRQEDTDTLVLEGVSGAAGPTPGAVKFCALARVRAEGGHRQAAVSGLTITNADAATILISLGTSYRNYQDVGGDPVRQAQDFLARATQKSYGALRRAHLADYQPRFRRFSLDLGPSAGSDSICTRRSKLTATSAGPPASRRCSCSPRTTNCTCCRPCRPPGRQGMCAACWRVAGSRWSFTGRPGRWITPVSFRA